MKILRVNVLSDSKGTMIYPEGLTTFQSIEHLYCDDLKENKCYLFVLVNDKDFDKILDKTNVIELSVADAEIMLDKYEKRVTTITDEGMVRAIEIKAHYNTPLSEAELKAIDPGDDEPGIVYRKRFIDRVKIRMGL